MNTPVVMQIKTGWLAKGRGWAVQASTREGALDAFRDAEEWHRELDARPLADEQEEAG